VRTVLTAGAVYSLTNSDAELFGNEKFAYTNSAAYLQLEKEFGDRVIASAGVRYEYNKQESPEEFMGVVIPGGRVTDGEIVSRLGLNYKIAEYSNIRVSWGQGYRYPTVTERFISTSFGSFNIIPNPLLRPEFGWSTEIAIKQGFKVNSFEGFLDLSAFVSEYDDMIEFTFKDDIFGFQPINIGNTRISGFEIGVLGKFFIGKIPISTLGGYTYINPIYKNFEEDVDLRNNLSTDQNILKYRSRHTMKLDLQADIKKFSLGVSVQYISHMINIDRRLETPLGQQDLFQIKIFRELNNNGFVLLDNRLSYQFDFAKVSVILSNVLNQAYTVRPGLLEAPRNISVRLDKSF
jgi:iron complex outermembrane receptor protein